jgi:prepilin signal peptidase PulO-like enzyme (type II secretory pathway)
MEYFMVTMVFIFGTIVGSFLNVVVLRHGFGEQARSRSGCSACEKGLKWYELVPVISFLILRGRCSGCESKLSWQYPIVELLTGAVFAASFMIMYPFVTVFQFLLFGAFLVFWASFIVLTTYDIKHTLIPMSFSLVLIASAFAVRIFEAISFSSMVPLYDAAIGAVIFGGFLLFLYLITRGKGMGLGDAYVGVALGSVFGLTNTLDVVLVSFWAGAIIGIVLLILKKGFKMKSEVPFVPFLFLGALIGAFTDFSPVALIARIVYGI